MSNHYEDNLFVQERHHCTAKPHLSHLWLYLQSLRTAQSLFDRAIVLQHMLYHNIPWRKKERERKRHIPTDVKRKRDTERMKI